MSEKPKNYVTIRELARRFDGIYTETGIRAWSRFPHRGPKRCEELRPLVAYLLEDVEEFERTNPRFLLRKSKLAAKAGGAQ